VSVPQIALVGYTNVGKSTFLNSMTGETAVYADDKLFATLDPTARRVRLPDGGWAVAVDTVGFIQRLPTTLIAAFRSTLEEVEAADCLLVVHDASSPELEAQRASVDKTLAELDTQGIPRVEVFNKCDRLTASERTDLARRHPDAILASAADGAGVDAALSRAAAALSKRWLLRSLDAPAAKSGAWSAKLYESAQILDRAVVGDKVRFHLRVTAENWARLRSMFGMDAGKNG
jgi:GTP-binding protein HflX